MKRAFKVKQKSFFIIFKGLSVAKNCLRPESAPLKEKHFSSFLIPVSISINKLTKMVFVVQLF